MDEVLFKFMPVAYWQWANLGATFVGGMLCAWMCFHRMDPDDFLGKAQFAVLFLRAATAMTGCALGVVCIASVESIAGIGPYHMPTEVALNICFAVMMAAVVAFHTYRRRKVNHAIR